MIGNLPECNFNVQLNQVYYAIDGPEAGQPQRVLASIQVDGGQTHDWLVAPKDFTLAKMLTKFYDLLGPPKDSAKKQVAHLLRQRQAELLTRRPYSLLQAGGENNSPPATGTPGSNGEQSQANSGISIKPGIYFSKTGWQRLPSGGLVFVAGDRVIGNFSEKYVVDASISGVHLATQDNFQRTDILRFLEMLMLEPSVYPAVWGFSLATALLSMFSQAQIDFQAVLYLLGEYNTGKSVIAARLFAIYDEVSCNKGQAALIFDFDASFPTLREKMAAFRDLPIVGDDVCTSVDKEIVRKRKQAAAKLLRFAANKTTQTKGVHSTAEELRPAAGLAITAELGLDSESEWSRFFPFEYAGYEEDGKIYLWPNAALNWVTNQRGYHDCTKIQISKYLGSTGILVREYGDAHDNTVHLEIDGERRRFLCLHKATLCRVASQDIKNY